MRLLVTVIWSLSFSVCAQEVSFIDPEILDLEMQQFQLSQVQAERVQRLRKLDAPYGTDNLSALELLGKYAENDRDRREFARKHVVAMADNVGRSQAWSLAIYDAARSESLLSQILAVNPGIREGLLKLGMSPPDSDYSAQILDKTRTGTVQPTQTLMVSLDCGQPCVSAFDGVQKEVLAGRVKSVDSEF